VDPTFFRPDSEQLVGNPALAARELDWRPRTRFIDLVHEMVDHDLAMVSSP